MAVGKVRKPERCKASNHKEQEPKKIKQQIQIKAVSAKAEEIRRQTKNYKT